MSRTLLPALLLLAACGADAPADGTPEPSATSPDPTGDPTPTDLTGDTPTPTPTPPTSPPTGSGSGTDTGLAVLTFEGQATVGADYVGEESFRLVRARDGEPLCLWTFDTLDWATAGETDPTPSEGVPCVDADGNPCDFAFDVRFVGGHDGGDGALCDRFGLAPGAEDAGVRGYGWLSDYQVGGASYGAAMMYFLDAAAIYASLPPETYFLWVPLIADAGFEGDAFDYTLEGGTLAYVP